MADAPRSGPEYLREAVRCLRYADEYAGAADAATVVDMGQAYATLANVAVGIDMLRLQTADRTDRTTILNAWLNAVRHPSPVTITDPEDDE